MTFKEILTSPDLIQGAIELFTRVRNIPYRLGLDGNPDKLFSEGVGNCTRKSLYLLSKLPPLGYKVEVGIAVFDWRQLPIPDEIISLLKKPVQRHMFLFANGQQIDPTWHPGIPGFTVSEWDGINPTPLGVPAIKIIKPNPAILQVRALASSLKNLISPVDQEPTLFNDAFNHWLEKQQN